MNYFNLILLIKSPASSYMLILVALTEGLTYLIIQLIPLHLKGLEVSGVIVLW